MSSEQREVLNHWVDVATKDGATPRQVAAAIGVRVGAGSGIDFASAPDLLDEADGLSAPPSLDASVWDLGWAYERSLDVRTRKTQGIHYTPMDVATRMAAIAVGSNAGARVCDPAVGTGAFLLAAAAHLESLGLERSLIVRERLWGVDLDADAIAVAKASLSLWAREHGGSAALPDRLVVGNTLELGEQAFEERAEGFDVVLGNPPFQSQLLAGTARSPEETQALRERWAVDVEPYADSAAFFLLAGLELARPGGTVALIQPRSVLASTSVEPIRSALAQQGALRGVWVGGRDVFDADVEVCAPFIVRRDPTTPAPSRQEPTAFKSSGDGADAVERWEGRDVAPRPPTLVSPEASSWAPLVSDLRGVPTVELGPVRRLADVASATAGFRDEFYGLADAAVDAIEGEGHPLITVGMIDPLRNRWGSTSFRLAGSNVEAPRVSLADLAENGRVERWTRDRLVPKLLVATQTKVIEVLVDEEGDLVPCTPVVAVAVPRDQLWHTAAALSSPVCSAVALSRVSGSALSADTIKLSAGQVLELPLPDASGAWDRAATLAFEAARAEDEASWRDKIVAMAAEMQAAYGVEDPSVLAWWQGRLPGWR